MHNGIGSERVGVITGALLVSDANSGRCCEEAVEHKRVVEPERDHARWPALASKSRINQPRLANGPGEFSVENVSR